MEKGSSSETGAIGVGIQKLFESSDTTVQVVDKAKKRDDVTPEDDSANSNSVGAIGVGIEKLFESSQVVDKAKKRDDVTLEDDSMNSNSAGNQKLFESSDTTVQVDDKAKKKDDVMLFESSDTTTSQQLVLGPSGKVMLSPDMLLDDLNPVSVESKFPMVSVSADGKVKFNKDWMNEDLNEMFKKT